MNIFDILFGIAALASLIYSYYKGAIREIFSLLSLVLGFAGVIHFYPYGIKWINSVIKNPTFSQIVSFLIAFLMFIAFAYIINQLGKFVRLSLKLVELLWVDKVGGVICGIVKVIILACIISSFLIYFLPSNSPTLRTSKLIPYFASINNSIRILIPPNIKVIYAQKLNELKNFWKKRKFREKYRSHISSVREYRNFLKKQVQDFSFLKKEGKVEH
ncbi:MAG: CvpA family protein [bacterium]